MTVIYIVSISLAFNNEQLDQYKGIQSILDNQQSSLYQVEVIEAIFCLIAKTA